MPELTITTSEAFGNQRLGVVVFQGMIKFNGPGSNFWGQSDLSSGWPASHHALIARPDKEKSPGSGSSRGLELEGCAIRQIGACPPQTQGWRGRGSSSNPHVQAPSTKLDSKMYRSLEEAGKRQYPGSTVLPGILTTYADMALLRARGIESYGFGSALLIAMSSASLRHRSYELVSRPTQQLVSKFEERFGGGVSREAKVMIEFPVIGLFGSE